MGTPPYPETAAYLGLALIGWAAERPAERGPADIASAATA
jgi:hypothetical protein